MMCALVLLLLLGTQLHAGAAAGQYNEANVLYRDGDFAAARRSYLEVVEAPGCKTGDFTTIWAMPALSPGS